MRRHGEFSEIDMNTGRGWLADGLRNVNAKIFTPLCLCLVLLGATACGHKEASKKPTRESARETRLNWNTKTLVDAYIDFGNMDAKWDETATNALIEYARIRSRSVDEDEPWSQIIATNCDAAIQAGCDDPMVRYLHIFYVMGRTNNPERFTRMLRQTADEMQESGYPPVRKFYAALRAAEQIKYEADKKTPPEVHHYRHTAMTNLAEMVRDKATPPREVDEACTALLEALAQNKKQYDECYAMIEGPLLSNWPEESFAWLIKGKAYIKLGWLARGGGGKDTVSAEAWKTFQADLAVAETALEKAWKLNPHDERIAVNMIRVAQGQHKSREEMERWFSRAMEANPNSYAACDYKLQYLYPQWYGSGEDMVAFGRECVHNPDWGGNVPLILPEVHRLIRNSLPKGPERNAYLKQPGVWQDLQSAYDRYFQINPGATARYYDYAWYAGNAEEWDTFLKLIPKLGKVNYDYFGGEEAFNKLVQTAQEQTKAK